MTGAFACVRADPPTCRHELIRRQPRAGETPQPSGRHGRKRCSLENRHPNLRAVHAARIEQLVRPGNRSGIGRCMDSSVFHPSPLLFALAHLVWAPTLAGTWRLFCNIVTPARSHRPRPNQLFTRLQPIERPSRLRRRPRRYHADPRVHHEQTAAPAAPRGKSRVQLN